MTTTITTGDLNKHFGVSMTTDFVKELGFTPAETARAGHPRWAITDVPAIGAKLLEHIGARMNAKVIVSPPVIGRKATKEAKREAGVLPARTAPVDEDDDL